MPCMLALAWNPDVGIPLLLVGVIVVVLIWLFDRPKPVQGWRRPVPLPDASKRESMGDEDSSSSQPLPGTAAIKSRKGELDMVLHEELGRLGTILANDARDMFSTWHTPVIQPVTSGKDDVTPGRCRSRLGRRNAVSVERIVSVLVMAEDGAFFYGPDLIVAAEKTGMEFGDLDIYHRLFDSQRESGVIFSMANLFRPGSFDLTRIESLRTPGLIFFMTLPAPISALDAWDAMLPTAKHLAGLLNGQLLDESRSALGRQRIASIRDELRTWDRTHRPVC